MIRDEFIDDVAGLLATLRARGLKLATAESCTGGLIAALATAIPGASDVFERGFVTYSNCAKIGQLGVDFELIERHGAVSAETAEAMANGALRCSAADVAISVTGIAGPDGGTPEKPVGLVYIGLAMRGRPTRTRELRLGNPGRSVVREKTVVEVVALLREELLA